MPIFTLSFELRNETKKHDYKPLIAEMQAQKCHPLMQNVWLGSFNNNATQIHTHFRKLLDKGDRLMVAELQQHYAYSNSMPNCNKWLELNPPAQYKGPDTLGGPVKKAAPAKAAPKVPAENPDKPAAASKKKAKA
jgi:hypothetical protein